MVRLPHFLSVLLPPLNLNIMLAVCLPDEIKKDKKGTFDVERGGCQPSLIFLINFIFIQISKRVASIQAKWRKHDRVQTLHVSFLFRALPCMQNCVSNIPEWWNKGQKQDVMGKEEDAHHFFLSVTDLYFLFKQAEWW